MFASHFNKYLVRTYILFSRLSTFCAPQFCMVQPESASHPLKRKCKTILWIANRNRNPFRNRSKLLLLQIVSSFIVVIWHDEWLEWMEPTRCTHNYEGHQQIGVFFFSFLLAWTSWKFNQITKMPNAKKWLHPMNIEWLNCVFERVFFGKFPTNLFSLSIELQ